jgi:hypothetical protein
VEDVEGAAVHVLSLQYRFKPISIDPSRATDVGVHKDTNDADVTIPTTDGKEAERFQGKSLRSTCEFVLSHVPGKGCTLSKIELSIPNLRHIQDFNEKEPFVAKPEAVAARSTKKRLQDLMTKKRKQPI